MTAVRAASVRVVKVGGSLFDLPDLPRRLSAWLAEQSPAAQLLLAGGGALAEAIRAADRRWQLAESAAHWLCVRAMGVSARLLAELLPAARLETSFACLASQCRAAPQTIVVDLEDFLRAHEPDLPPEPLPRSWQATSDSLAARLAEAVAADELVLLKSAPLPPRATWADAAGAGLVDPCFPAIAARLPSVRLVNLRDLPGS